MESTRNTEGMTSKPGWSGRAMLLTRYHCGGLVQFPSGAVNACPQMAEMTMNAQASQRLPTNWGYVEAAGYLCPYCLPYSGSARPTQATRQNIQVEHE